MFRIMLIIIGFLVIGKVGSMSLKGPVLTRYDPCGLGVVYFDKVTEILWKGVLNLGLYPHIIRAEIEINFNETITFYGVSQDSTIIMKNERRDIILMPKGKLAQFYIMYLSVNPNTTDNKPTVNKFSLNNVVLCSKDDTIGKSTESLALSEKNNLNHVCGRRSLEHAELMSVRADSKNGDWPWHVAILIREPDHNDLAKYQCGGNIISKTAILTAGHCMFLNNKQIETKRLVVVAGVSNLRDKNETGKQIFSANKVIIHPGYSLEHATSDLAIVTVDEMLFTKYVQPICIWGPVYNKSNLYGQKAVVTGFGLTEQDVLSNTLRSSYTIVQSDKTCIAYSPKLYSSLLNEFTFCAGEGPNSGTSPLNGDSGGGLIIATLHIDNKISWYLRGILSKCGVPLGKTVCDPKYYVIYTDIAPHHPWIYHNGGFNS